MRAIGHESSPTLGLVLTLVALAWLGENLHLDPGRVLGQLWPWPLILMLLGVGAFMGRSESSFARGLALILGGALVWASRAQLLPVPMWNIVAPLLLALVGVAVIWREMSRRHDHEIGRSRGRRDTE